MNDIIQRTTCMTVVTTLALDTTKAMGGKGSDLTTTVMATMWFTKCQAKTEADSNLKGAWSHPFGDPMKTMAVH